MRWGLVIGAGAGLLLVAATSRRARASTKVESSAFDLGLLNGEGDASIDTTGSLSDLRGDAARARLRQTAKSLENRYDIDGLADFLDAVANTETGRTYAASVRGDLNSKYGDSIGLYQIKTMSAYKSSDGLDYLQGTVRGERMLENPDLATIFAANHAVQAIRRARTSGSNRPCSSKPGPGDWLAVRRWWKYPSRVHDWCESIDGSVKTRERFEQALSNIGVSRTFMYETPDVSGWPGINQVLADYNISLEGNV